MICMILMIALKSAFWSVLGKTEKLCLLICMIKDLHLGIIVLSHYAVSAGLEPIAVLLPQVSQCCHYRHELSCENFAPSVKVADRIRAQLLNLHHEFFRERSSDGV